jgi:hypothetical protein
MFLRNIKNTLLVLVASFMGFAANAQTEPTQLTAYLERVTSTVATTMTQAAEQKITDPSALRDLAATNLGESITEDQSTAAIDIRAALYCNQCDGSPAARIYAVNIKDIIFPPTTGPTYPQDVINSLNSLSAAAKADTRLSEDARARVIAVSEGLSKFVSTLQALHDKYPDYFDQGGTSSTTSSTLRAAPCSSWWCRWGKCVVGTLGGTVTGGLTGALGGSAVPVIGTAVGGVVGAIGGGLTAAGTFCF